MFKNQIQNFNKNIIGLREFVNLISPFLDSKVEEHKKYVSPLLRLGILKEILNAEEDSEDDSIESKNKIQEQIEDVKKEILEVYEKEIDVEISDSLDTKEGEKDERNKKFTISFKDPESINISEHFENVHKANNHIEILYKNSLISLLSSVEWFLSQILHFYYDRHPESAGVQKKTMTLSELKSFGNVEDAEKHLINLKIEEILRGNFDSWINLLKTELSLKMGYINSMNDELTEIYQRRNLLVHNGGVVNSIYLSKVNDSLAKDVKIGDLLSVNKKYLNNAISKLQSTFILIACELWKTLDKEDKNRGIVLDQIVYENLLESRWDICESLTFFALNDAKLDTAVKSVAQLNHWLCKKRKGNLEEIRKEIDNVDFTDKKEIFQLALSALKDDKESFFELLPITLDSRQLNIERLEEFPIFKEMRDTDEYKKFRTESKYFKEPNQEILDY